MTTCRQRPQIQGSEGGRSIQDWPYNCTLKISISVKLLLKQWSIIKDIWWKKYNWHHFVQINTSDVISKQYPCSPVQWSTDVSSHRSRWYGFRNNDLQWSGFRISWMSTVGTSWRGRWRTTWPWMRWGTVPRAVAWSQRGGGTNSFYFQVLLISLLGFVIYKLLKEYTTHLYLYLSVVLNILKKWIGFLCCVTFAAAIAADTGARRRPPSSGRWRTRGWHHVVRVRVARGCGQEVGPRRALRSTIHDFLLKSFWSLDRHSYSVLFVKKSNDWRWMN